MISVIKKAGLLFLLFCVALVMNRRFGYITIIAIFEIFFVLNCIKSNLRIDICGTLLVLYCVLYLVLSIFNGFTYSLSTSVLYFFAPPIFYYFGVKIISFCKSESDLLYVWFIILLCYAVDTFFIGIGTILTTGEQFASERVLSFYDNQIVSATQVAMPLNIGVIGLPMFFIISDKRLKIYYLLLMIFSSAIVVYLVNRTGLVILAICLCAMLLVKGLKSKKYLIGSALSVIVCGLLFYYFSDTFNSDIVDIYKARNEIDGLDSRSDRWIKHFPNLISHPFGWASNGEIYYIHNMWLDVARVSGLLPFLLLANLSLYFIIKSAIYSFRYNTDSWLLIFGLNLCFFASCFVEPVIGGTHFMLYCLLWGCQFALDRNTKNANLLNR